MPGVCTKQAHGRFMYRTVGSTLPPLSCSNAPAERHCVLSETFVAESRELNRRLNAKAWPS